ncbi:dethiobiotin synthase [Rubinisphaera margarita]|uniref:dethiobiotin synthase n=1 Tax=Rubinisphaera margarita TaxID=2909586 RepID=UPI001EE85CB1|nr:dethiobiotin synthase [Rubinisphaera margarita]MCG6157983.1 dethiobiotin synthase [Rubinisphaera margarita]
MRGLFITGTDTGVGKTWIACQILHAMNQAGFSVGAYKPVCSGSLRDESGQQHWEDLDELAAATRYRFPLELIGPQRFAAAVAPPRAAGLEGRSVDEDLLVGGIEPWKKQVDYLLVEGAGGLLSPVSDTLSNLDLALKLGFPLLIVGRAGLGTINHSLLTIEVARSHGASLAGLLLNETTAEGSDLSRQFNVEDLSARTDCPVLGCWPFGGSATIDTNGLTVSVDWWNLFDLSLKVG